MRKLAIVESLGRTVNRVGFKLKKHSPEILVVTGIVGAVASAVMACKATTKLSDITEEAKEKIDDIHADIENGTQTEEDSKKELTVTYVQTAVKIAKLYTPSVILGGLSIGAILTSNNMLRKRNVLIAVRVKVENICSVRRIISHILIFTILLQLVIKRV